MGSLHQQRIKYVILISNINRYHLQNMFNLPCKFSPLFYFTGIPASFKLIVKFLCIQLWLYYVYSITPLSATTLYTL